jgi:hypothetical protein
VSDPLLNGQSASHEIIHLAGPVITFGPVQRQRCAWCGAVIEEWNIERVGMLEADRPPERQGEPVEHDELPRWEGLVAIDGCARWRVDEPEDHEAPERSCFVLLPSETGAI